MANVSIIFNFSKPLLWHTNRAEMRGLFFSSRGGFEHPQTNPEGEENCDSALFPPHFWLLLRQLLFVYSIIWLIIHPLSGTGVCTGCFIVVGVCLGALQTPRGVIFRQSWGGLGWEGPQIPSRAMAGSRPAAPGAPGWHWAVSIPGGHFLGVPRSLGHFLGFAH